MSSEPTVTGLQFECQPGCTQCCNTKGYVYLAEADAARIAAHLGLTEAEFSARHIYRTRHLRRLRKPRDRQCTFLSATGCTIHAVKPTQCRLFPFWPEYVGSRREWRELGRRCPGIGQGPLIQIGTAVEIASEMEQAYPSIYPMK